MIISFPRCQGVQGLSRANEPKELTVTFAEVPSDDELIELWLFLKTFSPADKRPEGWEPSDKSDMSSWEVAK